MKKFLCYDTNDATSGKINVDSRGMLNPNSTVPPTNGSTNQYLVTDGEGNTKWEDRLAYGGNRIRVSTPESADASEYVKVSDDFPTGSYDIGTRVYEIDSDEDYYENQIRVSNGEIIADKIGEPKVIVALHDNVTFLSDYDWSITLPEKGTYFAKYEDYFITGVVLGDSNEPEITWDGSDFVGKKIEQMYIPKQSLYLKLEEDGYENDVEQYKISMTLDEIIECIRNGINVVLVERDHFYYLTKCSDECITFVCNGIIEDDIWEFTITANSNRGPINNKRKYVRFDQGTNNANKFLVVNSSGYVFPSSDLIIPSSTPSSSKKFKITVDDSGTISATEV